MSTMTSFNIVCARIDNCRGHYVSFLCISLDNRLLENNTLLQIQCVKLEKDVHHLRLSNVGLERASVVK